MSERILNQVKYLCNKIAKVEWSGVLFYSVEGSIQDPENMTLTIEDILPMNKGTQAYTEYSFDQRVIDYMVDNETMEKEWKMGHIHSHNTMAVFFSGTDWSELEDNAPNHNFYLSLIVNNFMDFCAKVCFIAQSNETKTFNFHAKDEEGNNYIYESAEYEVKEKKLIVFDCAINSPSNSIMVEEAFSEKVTKIIEDADRRVITTPAWKNPVGYTPSNTKKDTPSYTPSWGFGDMHDDWDWESKQNAKVKDKDETAWKKTSQSKTGQELEDEIEHFSMFVLNTGNSIKDYESVEQIVEFYMGYKLSPSALTKGILDKYHILYDNFFDKDPEKDKPVTFIVTTELLIDEYEHVVGTTKSTNTVTMLKPVIEGLKSMLDKFVKYGQD